MADSHIIGSKIKANFLQKYKRKKFDPARIEQSLDAKNVRKLEDLTRDRENMFKKHIQNDLILTDSRKIADLRLTHTYRKHSKH